MALLEARDRVGGRTFTEVHDDGSLIDRGGAWIGPGQDRVYVLMSEFGVPSYKPYTDGEAMMVVEGKQYRYTVAAYDGAGNASAQSAPFTITTPKR